MDMVIPQGRQWGGSRGTNEDLESEGDEESSQDMSLCRRCTLVTLSLSPCHSFFKNQIPEISFLETVIS